MEYNKDDFKKSNWELTVEQLNNRITPSHSTVGELLDFIERNNISRDAKICVERVHDFYYENNHWATVRKDSEQTHHMVGHNQKVEIGLFNDQTPAMKFSEEDIKNSKSEYTPIWCPVKYNGDDNLYLDLHY